MKKIIFTIKERKREIAFFVLFFLIASSSFALGYLYARDFEAIPIIIEKGCES